MICQRTLARAVRTSGVGLHTGCVVGLELRPAGADSGIRFLRADLEGAEPIPARLEYVSDTRLRTTLARGVASVSTVEHLLAALHGLGIDNALVVLDGPEVPAMDGSARPFVELLEAAGQVWQDAARRWLRVKREVSVRAGAAHATLRPAAALRIDFSVEYPAWPAAADGARAAFDSATQSFAQAVGGARTFGFAREIRQMQAEGLARGGSLENAVVIEQGRVLNPGGLRHPDELVRHKILDAIGDLYLLGRPLLGELRAHRSGHTLNVALLRELRARGPGYADIC